MYLLDILFENAQIKFDKDYYLLRPKLKLW